MNYQVVKQPHGEDGILRSRVSEDKIVYSGDGSRFGLEIAYMCTVFRTEQGEAADPL